MQAPALAMPLFLLLHCVQRYTGGVEAPVLAELLMKHTHGSISRCKLPLVWGYRLDMQWPNALLFSRNFVLYSSQAM